jgi:2-polyprenyl-3-methyl-5-hydroxy-6-metoxy-1,4-benzoquinol methylase
MMDVLHHLSEPEPVLRQIARVVGENGVVILADFDEQGFDLVADVHRGEGHEHPRTTTTMEHAVSELEKAGFRPLERTRGYLHDVVLLAKRSGQ